MMRVVHLLTAAAVTAKAQTSTRKSSMLCILLPAVTIGLTATAADAAIVIDVAQSGRDVTATVSGTFNFIGMTPTFVGSNSPLIFKNAIVVGAGGTPSNMFDGLSGPSLIGTKPDIFYANSGRGLDVGLYFDGSTKVLYLPSTYVSGSVISSTSTFKNITIGSMGLNLGRYVFTAPNDTLTIDIGIGAVPEPATWATMLLGFGLVGGVARRRAASHARFNLGLL